MYASEWYTYLPLCIKKGERKKKVRLGKNKTQKGEKRKKIKEKLRKKSEK
jgi:hypothetical protein